MQNIARYFAYDYDGDPFVLFGTKHLIALAILGAIIAFLIWGWKNPSEKAKKRARITMIVVMLTGQAAWYLWLAYYGKWTPQQHLPLHLCPILILLVSYMLYAKNYQIYEVAYFLAIGGALQAVITPEAGVWGFPHFRAVQTTITHGTLVIAVVYMTTIEGFRPTWKSLGKTYLYLNLYLIIIYPINMLLGSNYLYVMHSPPEASLIDVMGPWPWYLLTAQFVGLGIFLLLYLPFIIKDWRAKRQSATVSS